MNIFQVEVATAQSKPEGLKSPVVSDVTSTSLKVTWTPPTKLNGILKGYTLYMSDVETVLSFKTTALKWSRTGKYSAIIMKVI